MFRSILVAADGSSPTSSLALARAGHYVLGSVPEQVLLTARSQPVLVIRTS